MISVSLWQCFVAHLWGIFCLSKQSTKAKTPRCHHHYQFPSDWNITHSPEHWSNERTMLQQVTKVIIPYVKRIRGSFKEDTPAVVIMDNFKGKFGNRSVGVEQYPMFAFCHQTRQIISNPWTGQATWRYFEKTLWRLVCKETIWATVWRERCPIDWLAANQLRSACLEAARGQVDVGDVGVLCSRTLKSLSMALWKQASQELYTGKTLVKTRKRKGQHGVWDREWLWWDS